MTTHRRLTQNDIAKLAGVSQATVSLVLNGAPAAIARIPEETRERVQAVIRQTGYVADPIARRMAKGLNRILGVFTYEPAFPSAQADFFTPFLLGIEEEAQQQAYDLLLLTSAGVGDNRKIFSEGNRLRIADGCLVLGREFDRKELVRLVSEDYPFVAIGRREDADGPVPYVGGDYAAGTRQLVEDAIALDTPSLPISARMVRQNRLLIDGKVSARRSVMRPRLPCISRRLTGQLKKYSMPSLRAGQLPRSS